MLKTNYYLFLLTVALAVAFSSCAHTKITSTWKDPAYQGHPKKILVHVMSVNPTVKIIFENQLVSQFEKHGMDALASHGLLPDDLVLDREAMRKLVREREIDTVFVAGPTNRKDLNTLRPGEVSYASAVYSDPGDNTFASVSGFVYSPGTYAEEDVSAEMVLYDVSAKKRIWSALSKTYVWNTRTEEIKPAVQLIIDKLVAEKIIP